MEERHYIKLKDLVGGFFEIQRISGVAWKKWDEVTKKMLVAYEPTKEYRKLYRVETNQGILDLGSGQMGNLLESVLDMPGGWSRIVGRSWKVASNGKEGMDIRYYFNPVEVRPTEDDESEPIEDEARGMEDIKEEPMDMKDIPF